MNRDILYAVLAAVAGTALLTWAFTAMYYADRRCAELGGVLVSDQCIDRDAILPSSP